MDTEKITIRLELGSSIHSFDIKREDEKLYRDASLRTNRLLQNLREKFENREESELIGIVALQLAYELEKEKGE